MGQAGPHACSMWVGQASVGVCAPAGAVLTVSVSAGEVGHHGSECHDHGRAGYTEEYLRLAGESRNSLYEGAVEQVALIFER